MLNNDKIVVVGAGGLLGANIVAAALNSGAKVIAVDINLNSMNSALIENKIESDGELLKLYSLDITDEKAVINFFDTQEGITGAVNCSYPRNKSYGSDFFDVSLDSFNENLSLHLGSAFLFSQQCAAYFKKNKHKMSLVNISSVYGLIAPKFDVYKGTAMTMPVEYAAIKSAITHLTRYISVYMKDSNFRINSVSPGGILNGQPEEFLLNYKEYTFGKGMLDVKDITGTILFLLSEQSKYINGQNIVVDDGFTL